MDIQVIKQKHEALRTAMAELCESAKSDQEFLSKIQDRGFWERLFANNTRDLAKAAMSQTELIEKVQKSFQDLLAIVKDAAERERQIVSAIDELRESGDAAIAQICDKLGKVIRAVAKENVAIVRMDMKVKASESAQDSRTAAMRCVQEISEYCQNASMISGEEFCEIVRKALRNHFSNNELLLRSEDKRNIAEAVKSLGVGSLDYDVGFGSEKLPADIIVEREMEILSPEGDRYTAFRDELIGIIDEFVSHKDEVDPKGRSIDRLKGVKAKLLESQFEIALIGEFQGGKSTTFNALCGGREISPRGLGTGGVKTSAAVITAQNIAGDETRNGLSEWAEITWLSEDALRRRIAEALHQDVAMGVPQLKDALNAQWQGLQKDDDDTRDLLQVATLQLRILESGRYPEISNKRIVPIDEFQGYVQFPKNWELRWGEGGLNADFQFEECLFACLDSVLVRIHSKYLERLGCRITDCPGLFVSKWDTDRALEVMSRSNAVWYLLNGNKEMGQDQKKVLQSIRHAGWHPKCFFTLNVKGDVDSTEGILKSNVTKIRNQGFNVDNRVFKYNAAVSFRLAQLDWIKSRKWSRRDVECLAVETAAANRRVKFEDAFGKLESGSEADLVAAIRGQIYKVLVPTGYYDDSLRSMSDDELTAELENFAGLKTIARILERHITSHGAAEILLGDAGSGAGLCEKIMKQLEADKASEEDAAKKQYEEAKAEWEADQKSFDKFISTVKRDFAFLESDTGLDEEFLMDFYRCEWEAIHKSAEEIAIEITISEWNSGHWTNTDVKDAATCRIEGEFERIFKLSLDRYAHGITKTSLYKNRIGDRITESWKRLIEEWDEMQKDRPHFEGLCPDSELVKVHINPFSDAIRQCIEIPSYFWEFFRNIADTILSWFGGTRETSEDRIRAFFKEKDPIGKALKDMQESCSKSKKFKELFAQARLQNKAKIQESIDGAESKFKDRIEAEQKMMLSSNEERQMLAKEAGRVRREVIEPRRTTIIDFRTRVKSAYGV